MVVSLLPRLPVLSVPQLGGRGGDVGQLGLEHDHLPHLALHVRLVHLLRQAALLRCLVPVLPVLKIV